MKFLLLTIFLSSSVSLAMTNNVDTAAIYSVPVEDPALTPYASYPVDASFHLDGETLKVEYELPKELVGRAVHFKAAGEQNNDGTYTVTGLGEGTIFVRGVCAAAKCKLYYGDLKIDDDKVENVVNGSYGHDPKLAMLKLAVARAFASDPVGVLELSGAFRCK